MNWYCKKFNELTPSELYAIIRLRNEVFVVEQNCVFQDADNKDQECLHVMAWKDDLLAAYARIVPPGVIYKEISIGRVVTSLSVRRSGIGRELVNKSIDFIYELFGKVPIKIGAQLYLKKFYEELSFSPYSDIYLEDGIEHIEMISNKLTS